MIRFQNLPRFLDKEPIKKGLSNFCKQNDIILLSFFGSLVKGGYDAQSDIDVLIKFKEGANKSLLDLVRLEDQLSKLFGRRVDLLTPDAISPYLREEILGSMQIVYEAG